MVPEGSEGGDFIDGRGTVRTLQRLTPHPCWLVQDVGGKLRDADCTPTSTQKRELNREGSLGTKLAMMANAPRLLVELFPELATEIEHLLSQQGESELARQVSKLPVIDRCRCGDDFCGMFYVLPKPKGTYGPGHRNVLWSRSKECSYLMLWRRRSRLLRFYTSMPFGSGSSSSSPDRQCPSSRRFGRAKPHQLSSAEATLIMRQTRVPMNVGMAKPRPIRPPVKNPARPFCPSCGYRLPAS
jgi:hypothetical protein